MHERSRMTTEGGGLWVGAGWHSVTTFGVREWVAGRGETPLSYPLVENPTTMYIRSGEESLGRVEKKTTGVGRLKRKERMVSAESSRARYPCITQGNISPPGWISEYIFSKICLGGVHTAAMVALEIFRRDRPFHKRIARRLHSPRSREINLEKRRRGCVILEGVCYLGGSMLYDIATKRVNPFSLQQPVTNCSENRVG